MSTTMESSRRWNGYVCPDCRFVFRVPRDHDGEGLVCPSCRRLLKIPTATDVPPALVAEVVAEKPQPPGERQVVSTESMVEKRRKRGHSKHKAEEEPSWEKESRRRGRTATGRGPKMALALVVGGVVIAGAAGLALTLLPGGKDAPIVVIPERQALVELAGEDDEVKLPEGMKRGEVAFLEEAQPLAKRFLEAETVGDLLPLVRNREEAEPRMRQLYPDGRVDAPGISAFNSTGAVSYRGEFTFVLLRTRDYGIRQLAFAETEEGLKIDWESYVGWSDMEWEEFVRTKPTRSQVFRVWVKRMEYYNFGFSNDVEWQSYQILSPDKQRVLYGYVKRDSPVDGQVRPDDKKREAAMMLSLKFRPGETSENQVVIERHLADGWVEGIEGE